MSFSKGEMAEEERQVNAENPFRSGYIPSAEEMAVFEQCQKESFTYRSLPLSLISVVITKALMTRGVLSTSARFGQLPKLGFAALMGYLAGKLSYVKACQEKFMKLENSPVGELLRKRTGTLPQSSTGSRSELSDPDMQSFDSMFQSAEAPSQRPTHTRDAEYDYSPNPPSQTWKADDFENPEEDPTRKAPIRYENLRQKNRENYDVILTQKADTTPRGPALKEPERPKRAEKKNIYGDSLDE